MTADDRAPVVTGLLIAVLVRKLSRYRAYYRAATGAGSDVAGRRGR
jgi:hypothetical protein